MKAGTPVRTEIGFFADPAAFPMPYVVDKLDPALLDRESHYGTLGAEVAAFPEVRVWNSGVTLDIRSTDGSVVVADNIPFGAEVNSSGRVVYGFNWQKPLVGEHVITVRTNGIALGSTDAGTLVDSNGDGYNDTVTLVLTAVRGSPCARVPHGTGMRVTAARTQVEAGLRCRPGARPRPR